LLRLLYLGTNLPGLYNDELYFLLSAYAQVFHIAYLTVPNYNLFDFIFYSINGYIPALLIFHLTPFSARFPVAFYGSLMVLPLYLVTLELFKNERVAFLSSLLWAISPSAVVTSRVGYGVEIFPLFLFLFFLVFWLKFLRTYNLKFLVMSLFFIILMLFFPSIRIWSVIPLVGILIFTILPKLKGKVIPIKVPYAPYANQIAAFSIALVAIWLGLLYSPVLFSKIGYKGLLAGLPDSFILVNEPFPHSLLEFFIRIGYALAPWKTFWFDEFTATGLNYSSPVNVPSMLMFLFPFFYASVFCIPFFWKNDQNVMRSYNISIALMLFGLIQPVFNITNTYSNFEPSEGIFALPFYCILAAFSLYQFLKWMRSRIGISSKSSPRHRLAILSTANIARNKHSAFAVILMSSILIFAGINSSFFLYDLYVEAPVHYEDSQNDSLNFMFYGWYHVTEYLVKNNLENYTLYYTPSGNWTNSTSSSFNYWFYHQNFPLYWLYTFSDGKIRVINPIFSGQVPSHVDSDSLILSQNSSYVNLLLSNGIDFSILYTVFRANGTPAIEIIKV
jgi:hypothetical protein